MNENKNCNFENTIYITPTDWGDVHVVGESDIEALIAELNDNTEWEDVASIEDCQTMSLLRVVSGFGLYAYDNYRSSEYELHSVDENNEYRVLSYKLKYLNHECLANFECEDYEIEEQISEFIGEYLEEI